MNHTEKFQDRRYLFALAAIILLGVFLRVITVINIPTVPVSDFWSYFQRAISLADRGVYEAISGRPDASYPPLYPLLLSLFFKLPLDRLLIAKIINIVLSGLGILLISAITNSFVNKKTAIIAGLIYSINPRSILSCVLLASENLFIPLLLLWVLVLIQNNSVPTVKRSFLGGLVLGLCSLTKSISWLLSITWLISLVFQKIPFRKFIINLVTLIIAQAIILLPWGLRNFYTLGQGTFLTSTSGINLFIGNNSKATGEWYPWIEDMKVIDANFENESIVEQNKRAKEAALEWIYQNPGKALSLYINKLSLILNNDNFVLENAIFGKQLSPPWPAADVLVNDILFIPYKNLLYSLINLSYWVLSVLGVIGVFLSILKKTKDHFYLSRWTLTLLTILYFPCVSAIFLASTRFHWPSADLLIVFSSISLCLFFNETEKLTIRIYKIFSRKIV